MRMQPWRLGVLAVMAALCWGATAGADVTTERSGSILVFPKVIADGTRDTVIQISNTSNSLVRAHCFYVNGALWNPSEPQGPLNPPLWQEVDFDIVLTKQQPTLWSVSFGRNVNPFDPTCGPGSGVCIEGGNSGATCWKPEDCDSLICSNISCIGAGFDPGLVPPVVPGFTGELKCIEVDDSGAPLSGNHLKGEATLVVVSDTVQLDFATSGSAFAFDFYVHDVPDTDEEHPLVVAAQGEVSKYNALAILGNENNGDGTLVLGGGQCVGDGAAQGNVCTSDDDCGDAAPCAPEYNACPQTWILNHVADGAPDPVYAGTDSVGPQTGIYTELTVVPCTQNFETQEPTSVTLQFLTTNEFESQFSSSTTVTCWGSFFLGEMGVPALTAEGQPFPGSTLGTMYLQTRIRSAEGTPFGALIVAEESYLGPLSLLGITNPEPFDLWLQFVSSAAMNLHVEGERPNPDVITVPNDQLIP